MNRKGVFISFAIFASNALFLCPAVSAQQTYTVSGSVFDQLNRQPVTGAQVWLYGHQAGDATDSLGVYSFEVTTTPASTRLYVRLCGNDIMSFTTASFAENPRVRVDFHLDAIPTECVPPLDIPWQVDPSAAIDFDGHVTLDMHGEFFKTCDGKVYLPVWADGYSESERWNDDSKFGDRQYIRFNGRLDAYSLDVIPAQSVFVGDVLTLREPSPEDCEVE